MLKGFRSLSVNLSQHSIQVPPAGLDVLLWLAPCSEVHATGTCTRLAQKLTCRCNYTGLLREVVLVICPPICHGQPPLRLQGYEFKVYPSSCAFLIYANLRTTSASAEERYRAVHSFTGALWGWKLSFATSDGLDFRALYRLRPSLPRPYQSWYQTGTGSCSAGCRRASRNVDSNSRVKGPRPSRWNELAELKGASSSLGKILDRSDRWHCPFEAKNRLNPRIKQAPSLRQPSRFRA